MNDDRAAAAEAYFRELAQPLVDQTGITRSSMMGFPCLRREGDFFVSCDRRNGNLVVKLDEARVTALIDAGQAEPFAPNGRRFREWATIPFEQRRHWVGLIDEALHASAARAGA